MSNKAMELLANMKSTAASRYNAAKRLEERELSLTRLTAFTSAYVVGLTAIPYFIHLPPGSADRMNLLALFLAMVILVASLVQYSARYGVNAEQHYRCGLEIGEMRRRLKIMADTMSETELVKMADEYALILQKYSINHDQVDFDQYRIERTEEARKLTFRERFLMRFKIAYSRHLANLSLIGVTLAVIWLVLAIVTPAWRLAAPATGG